MLVRPPRLPEMIPQFDSSRGALTHRCVENVFLSAECFGPYFSHKGGKDARHSLRETGSDSFLGEAFCRSEISSRPAGGAPTLPWRTISLALSDLP